MEISREKIKEALLGQFKDIDHERLEVLIEGIIVELVKILQENDEAEAATEKSVLKTIISQKNLKVKEVDGHLRGEIDANFRSASSYAPDEAKLKKINKFSLEEQTESSVISVSLLAADTKIDRGHERFESKAIDTFCRLYPDKPVLLDHNWSAKDIVGKVYEGNNVDGDLILEAFLPRCAGNGETVEKVLSGIYSKLSVGFAADPEDMVCSACSKSMFDADCRHQPGDILKDGSMVYLIYKDITDVFEVSIVGVPMNAGCSILPKNLKEGRKSFIVSLPGMSPFNLNMGEIELKDFTERFIKEGNLTITSNLLEVNEKSLEIESKDRIVNDTDTIRNSSTMEENQVPDNEPKPETEVETPPAAVETPPVAVEKDLPVDGMAPPEPGLHSKLDAMHEHMKAMDSKLDALHEKCAATYSMMKALPSNEALEKQVAAIEETIAEVKKTLDINVRVSTDGVNKLLESYLAEEKAAQSSAVVPKKKTWAEQVFAVDNVDLGGQK